MKHKFLILISSLLLVPLTLGEVFIAQPLECINSEIEEETYINLAIPVADDVIIEDGGSLGNGILFQEYTEIVYADIPVRLCIGISSNIINPDTTPRYITYCRLKIAC